MLSQAAGFQCCQVVRPLCLSSSILGWSAVKPRGAVFSVPWPCTSTPAARSDEISAASSAPSGPATAARYLASSPGSRCHLPAPADSPSADSCT